MEVILLMMKKAIVPLIGLMLMATFSCAGAQGLLENSEFSELDAEDRQLPASWTTGANFESLYQIVNFDGYQDSFSVHYRVAEETTHGIITQRAAVEPNKEYVLTAAMKSDGTLQPAVRVHSVDRDQPVVTLISKGEQTWTLYTATFNSGNSQQVEVQLFGDRAMTHRTEPRAPVGFSAIDAVQIYPASAVPESVRPRTLFTPPGPNVALHKPYTYNPEPNYGLSAHPDDVIHLTDGVYTVGYFWAQKSTVGWNNRNPVTITVDLETVEPIAGASVNTAAGTASVSWPTSIMVFASEDGEQWTFAGDLVFLGTRHGAPSPSEYSVFRYATDAMAARGRYVRFVIEGVGYRFVDEVEVYRGSEELLAQAPEGPVTEDTTAFYRENRMYTAVNMRMRSDLFNVRDRIAASAIDGAEKARLMARVEALEQQVTHNEVEINSFFRAILPLDRLHSEIFALNAPVLRSRGLGPLTAWAYNRWDMLHPFQAPAAVPAAPPALRVDMLAGEYRGEVFNLTNATDSQIVADINISGLPGGVNPDYITVREVLFTDTSELIPIASALPQARQRQQGHAVSIPAGMTRQVWLQFNPRGIPAGEYSGTISVRAGRGIGEIAMPLSMKLYPAEFPEEVTLNVGGWDYTMGRGGRAVTLANIPPLIELLREYWVNTPWATVSAAPREAEFDADGHLVSEQMDFAVWDEWVERWAGVRHYYVFMSVGTTFYGERMGTDRFNTMVGEYFKAWTEHMQAQGLEPNQLAVLLVDEPNKPEQDEIIVAWSKAIKPMNPDVVIFNDPFHTPPDSALPGLLEMSDVLCPNTMHWRGYSEEEREMFRVHQERGAELWLYSCAGPANLLDLHTYFRGQNWWLIHEGGLGTHYWAFSDTGGTPSSWNPYAQTGTHYIPIYLDSHSVTPAKQIEAIREGVADYEYFVILRSMVEELEQRGVSSPLIAEVRQFMVDGPAEVVRVNEKENANWLVYKDRTLMDTMRIRALQYMEALSAL